MSALLHKNTLDRDKSKHSSSVDDSIHFLAACYGAVGCQDARARLRGLGCQMYVGSSLMNALIWLRLLHVIMIAVMNTTAACWSCSAAHCLHHMLCRPVYQALECTGLNLNPKTCHLIGKASHWYRRGKHRPSTDTLKQTLQK